MDNQLNDMLLLGFRNCNLQFHRIGWRGKSLRVEIVIIGVRKALSVGMKREA